ncbi:hypothetical protein DXA57_13115 [Blautia sp. OF03-15BH]|uniref:hypothetical protein n=1 Tax=Blautia sp. OF03-15BH TaxID=2292287 RepID=UPI000E51EAEB|nr:hypothetical protein [Blautia sp. OF03-15BH]RGX99152.1 hypothetical protein DXA57_13115 [Blautia sp. OF03-15BH]
MKNRLVFRIGTFFLSASFMMGVIHTAADQNVLAEEASGEELITIVPEETEAPQTAETSSEEAGSTVPEETEVTETPETAEQQTTEKASETAETETDPEVVIVPDVRETEGTEPTEVPETENQETEEIQTEITLPGKSVVLPVSAFLPLQEEKTPLFLNAYSGLYLLHIKSDQEMTETLLFNQNLKEEDVVLYRFDAEKNGTADTEPVSDVLEFQENGKLLSLSLNAFSDYVLVISHAEAYAGLGCTVTCTAGQMQETEGSGEGSDIIVIDPEPETESETASEPESESVTEAETESETASEPESESVTETERTLTSVSLKVDQDLESVPVTFLEQLNELDVYSVVLVYSDGSTSLPDETEEACDVSVDYEDVSNADGSVHRTYHAVVKELENGKEFEDSSSIDIGIKTPAEIKTEEMTTVILEGKKKWAVVRSTPEITGRYAMNSDRLIKKMYYASEGGEAVCAEKAFELQAGITYQFLISLN